MDILLRLINPLADSSQFTQSWLDQCQWIAVKPPVVSGHIYILLFNLL